MKSLFNQNVYVIGFGSGVVVKEKVIESKVKCTVEFDFNECIPTCNVK